VRRYLPDILLQIFYDTHPVVSLQEQYLELFIVPGGGSVMPIGFKFLFDFVFCKIDLVLDRNRNKDKFVIEIEHQEFNCTKVAGYYCRRIHCTTFLPVVCFSVHPLSLKIL